MCSLLFPGVSATLLLAAAASAQHTARASVDSFGGQAGGQSYGVALSSDGRYVAFASEASNLVPSDTNGVLDVFVYDAVLLTTRRASLSSGGVQGDAASGTFIYSAGTLTPALSISGDGRRVAFVSLATNFGGGSNSGLGQVYVRDLQNGTTLLASPSMSGGGGDGVCEDPRISADGRHVVFLSGATDLCPNDPGPYEDIYARDLQNQTTVRILSSVQVGNDFVGVYQPAISATGRYVAYFLAHYVYGTSNQWVDIHVLDRDADGNGILDETGGTNDIAITSVPNGGAFVLPSISSTGRFLTFLDYAGAISGHDRDTDNNGVFDEAGGVSTFPIATEITDSMIPMYSRAPISTDGRRVAFLSYLGPPLATTVPEVLVHDLVSGTESVVSYNGSTGEPGLGAALTPSIAMADDGSRVASDTISSNLVSMDTNGLSDVFLFRTDDPNCFGTTTYCTGAPNSAGLGGLIGWSGSLSVADNATTLTGVGLPPGVFGLFLYGGAETQVPFGDGFLCVASGGAGIHRLPAVHADAQGRTLLHLRFDLPPLNSGAGAVVPGGAWNFQLWYRDHAAGGAGFNTTDALHAVFCP